jgi:Transmembrane amino acid transporter protein
MSEQGQDYYRVQGSDGNLEGERPRPSTATHQRQNSHHSHHSHQVSVTIKGNAAYFHKKNVPKRLVSYLSDKPLSESIRIRSSDQIIKIEGIGNDADKRSLVERYFSKMEEGSLRASIFALVNVALGAGILSLPYVLKMSGFVIGTLLILLGGFTSFGSNVCLMKAHTMTNVNSYAELVRTAMGPMSSKFLEMVTVFHGYGVTVSYFVIMATDVKQILFTFFIDHKTANEFWVWTTIILIAYVLLLPLVCRRTINELRYFNFLGVIAALYPAVLVCLLAPFFIQNEFYPKVYEAAKFNLNIVTSFSVCLFAFTCQIVVIPVKLELKNPTEIRLIKVD